jgi:RNA polymerase sigma factor (TIGR02999 family)
VQNGTPSGLQSETFGVRVKSNLDCIPQNPCGIMIHDIVHVVARRFGATLEPVSDVTHMLQGAQEGDSAAADQLLPLVYEELRRLAASKMSKEAVGQTLQPTALVHEAWLRLVGNQDQTWNNRGHFFGAAAEAMRRILIENARRKGAQRHGGGKARLDVDEMEIAAPAKAEELLAVSDALEKFAVRDKQKAELVKLRYFVGFTTEEAAQVLGISVATADRWWNFSRAWLYEEIERQQKL